MIKILSIVFILVLIPFTPLRAKTIRIGVIDTGYDFKATWKHKGAHTPIFCDVEHKDFTTTKENPNYLVDNHGHGTHVAGLIARYAKGLDYCLVIVKFYDPTNPFSDNLVNSIKSFQYLLEQNVDVVNYSGGGLSKTVTECSIIKKALDQGIIFVTAAGNEGSNLKNNPYYPAMCDDRVIIVTNLHPGGKKLAPSSNYSENSKIEVFSEKGTSRFSTLPGGQMGNMTGTSQAAAIMTGKIVKLLSIRALWDEKNTPVKVEAAPLAKTKAIPKKISGNK